MLNSFSITKPRKTIMSRKSCIAYKDNFQNIVDTIILIYDK